MMHDWDETMPSSFCLCFQAATCRVVLKHIWKRSLPWTRRFLKSTRIISIARSGWILLRGVSQYGQKTFSSSDSSCVPEYNVGTAITCICKSFPRQMEAQNLFSSHLHYLGRALPDSFSAWEHMLVITSLWSEMLALESATFIRETSRRATFYGVGNISGCLWISYYGENWLNLHTPKIL